MTKKMFDKNEIKSSVFTLLLITFLIMLVISVITFVYNQISYDDTNTSVTREKEINDEIKSKETATEKETRLRNNRVEFIKIINRYQQNGHISYGITEDDLNSDIEELDNIEESNFKTSIIKPFLKDLEKEIENTEKMKKEINDFIAKRDKKRSLSKAEELYSYTKNVKKDISSYDEFKNKSYSLQNYIKQEKRNKKDDD